MSFAEPQPGSDWIVAGGEMGRLIRSMDWSLTPLGPIASWPQSLRTTVNLCLASDLPICLIWGADLVQIYNDAYRVICGGKHPHSMGQHFKECWLEAWPVIGAAHDSARAGDTAFLENQHIFLERHGYTEECFFTFSFSPIRDETGRLAGLFHPVIETTPKMLGERRTRTLRDLASRTSQAKLIEEAFALTTETLAEYPLDLPFLLIYRLEETEQPARLVASTGLAAGTKGAPAIAVLNLPDHAAWPLAEAFCTGGAITVDDVAARFGNLSAGPFSESIASAVLLPITPPGAERPVAVVVAGISPRLKSNEMLRGFHDLLSGAITTAIANAGAYEEERKRAEALAEIDRAKTAFFSNVSHEFRTPLTLMLGPTEELLALPPGALPSDTRAQIDVIHRNSLRLQKLVNSLLDFSRLEAGRIQASYRPVDLAAVTSDLASVFRSAIEKAGLKFTVECPPLPEPVFVDRDMWEKIVLNLISNAFKFTLSGEIEVGLKTGGDGQRVELTVRDTGTGIAPEELPRIFERFHRVEGAVSRTHEGTGIGLALVQEQVKLHGGTISVVSVFGKGSTFTVALPQGMAHLPPDRLGTGLTLQSTAVGAAPFLEEAARWLPEEKGEHPHHRSDEALAARSPQTAEATSTLPHILLADDNADMREYVRRLLAGRFRVETAPDGHAALEFIQRSLPDLVITDVMMPRLDGFGLVQRLRADARTSTLPIILLSARAGEEARVEGLQAGADDYLIKPFSARELLARVESQLKLAAIRREAGQQVRELNTHLKERVSELQQTRRAALNLAEDSMLSRQEAVQSEERFRAIAENIPQLAWLADGAGHIGWFNRRWLDYTGTRLEDNTGAGWKATLHPEHKEAVAEKLERHLREGKDWEDTFPLRGKDGQYRWFLSRTTAIRDETGKVVRFFGTNTDITELRETEQALGLSEQRFRTAVSTVSNIVWTNNTDGKMAGAQPGWEAFTGQTREEHQGYGWTQAVHPEDAKPTLEAWKCAVAEKRMFVFEHRIRRADGEWRLCSIRSLPLLSADGAILEWVGVHTDITERKQAEADLAFLATITEELVGVRTVDEIMHSVGAKIGAHFALSVCNFVEIDEATGELVVHHEWRRDNAPATIGTYKTADYVSPEFQKTCRAGELFVVRDTANDPRIDAGKHAVLQIRAWVGVPLVREGEWKFFIAFHDSAPREWRAAELDLMREITVRIWACVERTRSDGALREAKAAAEAANRAKDRFLAVLSHELRTPLNPVLLLASEAAANPALSPEVREDFAIVVKNVTVEAQLIDDLLDLTKITQGKLHLEMRPLDAHAVLRDAIELIKADIAEKRINLTVLFEPGNHVVSGDPVRLQQVFWNVLKNAVKFTPSKGNISVTTRSAEGDRFVIETTDTGIGLTPDELTRVFEAFAQGNHAQEGSAHQFGGLGLGLAISRTLVELHGGSLRATSPGPGFGATFAVELPLQSTKSANESRPVKTATASSKTSPAVRILLVEDHAPTLNALELLLRRRHHKVTIAATVSEARALASAQPFDLVISDIGLPDASGYELMTDLRHRFQLKGIALSGYGTENDIEKGRKAGFVAHLTKPVNVRALDATLSAVLHPDFS